jgi:hypothetical protein
MLPARLRPEVDAKPERRGDAPERDDRDFDAMAGPMGDAAAGSRRRHAGRAARSVRYEIVAALGFEGRFTAFEVGEIDGIVEIGLHERRRRREQHLGEFREEHMHGAT